MMTKKQTEDGIGLREGDLTGVVVNDILVVGLSHIGSQSRAAWFVECEAGHTFTTRTERIRKGTARCAICASTKETVSYSAMHKRIRNKRGSARKYACIDCGLTAKQWSLTHGSADTLWDSDGEYSLSMSDYVPRCVPCHKKYDSEGR